MRWWFIFILAVVIFGSRSSSVLGADQDGKEDEKVHVKVTSLPDNMTQAQATDGKRYLLALYRTTGIGDVNCYTNTHTSAVTAGGSDDHDNDTDTASIISDLTKDPDTITKDVEADTANALFIQCSKAPEKAAQTLASLTNTTAPVYRRVAITKRSWWWSRRMPQRFGGWVIYPGTKWCGTGSKAAHYNDLGLYTDVDKCCRTHDGCDKHIRSWKKKYNLFNWYVWTLSHCDCDDTFKQCLRNVPDGPQKTAATSVEMIFFRLLGIKCFNLNSKGNAVLRS